MEENSAMDHKRRSEFVQQEARARKESDEAQTQYQNVNREVREKL